MKKAGIILVGFVLFMNACIFDEDHCIDGNGYIVSEEIEISSFSGIHSLGANNITVKYGTNPKVVATGSSNIIDKLEKDVKEGIWEITLDGRCFRDADISIEITVPELSYLGIEGSGKIDIIDTLEDQNQLQIWVMGSGNINAYGIHANTCYVKIFGSGVVEVFANNILDVEIDGSAEVNYKGNPTIISDIKGTGTLIDKN